MYRILIVEDDSTIASNVAAHLERWDYETKQIEDFKCVMEAFQQFDPQLVILDIGLPFYNGFYWCQEIRKISSVPILFLSSMNDNMNIVMAMNMGGDELIHREAICSKCTNSQGTGITTPGLLLSRECQCVRA